MFPLQGGAPIRLAIEDVFSPYIYTGNGGSLTVANGINLVGDTWMFRTRRRSNTGSTRVVDSATGLTVQGQTDTTAAYAAASPAYNVTALSNGYSINTSNIGVNNSGDTYVSWTYSQASRFFKMGSISHTNGVASTVDLSSLGVVGMVEVKRTNGTSNWFVRHRSLSSGKLLYLNLTDAETTDSTISVSGTTLTLASTVATGTYVYYAYAHDSSADGVIQCASFTTNGSGAGSFDFGWTEGVQYIELKCMSTTGDWEIFDTARTSGFSGNDARLWANITTAEDSVARLSFSGTTLSFASLSASQTYIFNAVRAPS